MRIISANRRSSQRVGRISVIQRSRPHPLNKIFCHVCGITHALHHGSVGANAFRFLHYRARRVSCFACAGAVVMLGEALRVDLAEGGYLVIHNCLPCVRRRNLRTCAFDHGSVSAHFGVDRRAA